LILAEAAKRIGATVQAVAGKETEFSRRRDRVARFLQKMLERSAISGAGGEPYFGPGIDVILSKDYYSDAPIEPMTETHEVDNDQYIQVTSNIIKELCEGDNVVIVGRGGNMILKDVPNVFHVGIIAPRERRISTIMQREHMDYTTAALFVDEHELARESFYERFFAVAPNDPNYYHMIVNMRDIDQDVVAKIVSHAAQDLES